jgi:hypothetical protein
MKITCDIEWTCKWKDLVEGPSGSSRTCTSQDQQVPGEFPEPTDPLPLHGEQPAVSEDEVDQLVLAQLAQEGGVKFLDLLLAKAVPPFDLGSPDTSNIREWTFRDIQKMPNDQKQEWRKACRKELELLRKCDVYDLVDRPKQRKVIKNRWVFDLKPDGQRKARLVAKGFTHVEGIDYNEIFSPVVWFETVQAMLSLSALKRLAHFRTRCQNCIPVQRALSQMHVFSLLSRLSPLSLDMIRWLVTDPAVHDEELKNSHMIVRYHHSKEKDNKQHCDWLEYGRTLQKNRVSMISLDQSSSTINRMTCKCMSHDDSLTMTLHQSAQ